MAETRKNHLAIDGAKVKDDEHISSYKPIPEADSELRFSKPSLLKSKEKLSADGAEEKLLQKEDEAKISTRVDMADAKYVVGDHRNGDAKIELDANKKQFSGLTKEELLKYADDPFWVRLRWAMFALFWVLWLAMLAGAIAIIIRAPSCPPPPPKTWFEKGPLIEGAQPLSSQETFLRNLQAVSAQGMFVAQEDPYGVLDDAGSLDELKALVEVAKKYGVKVIADLAAGFVSSDHAWFQQALNGTEFASYFIWAKPSGYNNSVPLPPNYWISAESRSAWEWNPVAGKFYYQMHGVTKPQLNFTNPEVVRHFDEVLKKYMKVGIGGVRLVGARELLVNASLAEEGPRAGRGVDLSATMDQRAFWRQRHTSDQPELAPLLRHWAHVARAAADAAVGEAVFTIAEDGARPEQLFLQQELGFLRPPAAAPALAARPPADLAKDLAKRLGQWPAIELKQDGVPTLELAALAALLPAAPVLQASLFSAAPGNGSDLPLEAFGRLTALRGDASIEHGNSSISAVPARNSSQELLVCARWKAGHTGYAAVWNPSAEEASADLSAVPTLPTRVSVYYASLDVKTLTNYTMNQDLESNDIRVPAWSTVVLSYVPVTTAKK